MEVRDGFYSPDFFPLKLILPLIHISPVHSKDWCLAPESASFCRGLSLRNKVSCNVGWPPNRYVAEEDLELLILLVPPPKRWYYRQVPPHLVPLGMLWIEQRASHMIDTQPTTELPLHPTSTLWWQIYCTANQLALLTVTNCWDVCHF